MIDSSWTWICEGALIWIPAENFELEQNVQRAKHHGPFCLRVSYLCLDCIYTFRSDEQNTRIKCGLYILDLFDTKICAEISDCYRRKRQANPSNSRSGEQAIVSQIGRVLPYMQSCSHAVLPKNMKPTDQDKRPSCQPDAHVICCLFSSAGNLTQLVNTGPWSFFQLRKSTVLKTGEHSGLLKSVTKINTSDQISSTVQIFRRQICLFHFLVSEFGHVSTLYWSPWVNQQTQWLIEIGFRQDKFGQVSRICELLFRLLLFRLLWLDKPQVETLHFNPWRPQINCNDYTSGTKGANPGNSPIAW